VNRQSIPRLAPARSHFVAATRPFTLALATDDDRETIYRIRHEVYARELGQHPVNGRGVLDDSLDGWNVYLVAKVGFEIAGFISITPPSTAAYSIDKYFPRESLPFPVDQDLYELRLLTVLKPHRGRELAALLMFAALRWVETHNGKHIVAIGRHEIVDLYLKAGLELVGPSAQAGAVTYDLLHATTSRLASNLREYTGLLAKLEKRTHWQLDFPFQKPTECFHGGAFFQAIGTTFKSLERSETIINADVLDAWFPPAPRVLSALQQHLPWLLRTSPPANCEGLVQTIAAGRGVGSQNILPGAGSSDLIFRVFRHWLTPDSRVLILDPTYGEYAHVLERVIRCSVDRLPLRRENNYQVDLTHLTAALRQAYDLVALVNPNSPTGRHIHRNELEAVLRHAPRRTRIWVDETYIEYSGGVPQSLERAASASDNLIVCKSMSKVYALSGARVAYLCSSPQQLEELRAITPPWVVGLPTQVAAVHALQESEYYAARYAETAGLREALADQLRSLGWEIIPGVANFLLCHLPSNGPTAAAVVQECRTQGLFLRDAAAMGVGLGDRTVRIAVKDSRTNARMVEVLKQVIASLPAATGAQLFSRPLDRKLDPRLTRPGPPTAAKSLRPP
jgi:histidinol-phosphate/aromatic aminotransferase/cobyric acid decarboxylase-like protein/GNAT superfamily N-acetyltransferase